MSARGKHYSSARARRASRNVADATIGTHVDRSRSSGSGRASRSRSRSDIRYAKRASDSHVDVLAPSTASGEDQVTYRRRSQQARYIEAVHRRARRRRILVFIAAAIFVLALAAGAFFLVFRGVVGSEMALRDSNAREVLSAADEDEALYTLVSVELGSVAVPLDGEGPDMLVLVRDDRKTGKMAFIALPPALKVTVDNDTRRLADMAKNGDASLISAVESYAKIDVNHFVKVEKGGVEAMVDALGGIEVTFDQVLDDPHAGDVYYPMGTYTLNGQGALTYLRANNLHMGKTDQMNNQMGFIKLILDRLIGYESGFSRGIEVIDSYFQTDMTLNDLEDFARRLDEVGTESIASVIVPGYFTASSDVVDDTVEVYVSKASDFADLVASLEAEAESGGSSQESSIDVDPQSFTVAVMNGTDIAGAAKTTAEALDAEGFRIADVGNAEQQVYDETLVVYRTRNTPKDTSNATGNAEDGQEGAGENGEGAMQDGAAQPSANDAAALTEEEQAARDEEERTLGEARANKVISAIGLGRVVEGDMYYSFNADVLLIIGYDYKPVA